MYFERAYRYVVCVLLRFMSPPAIQTLVPFFSMSCVRWGTHLEDEERVASREGRMGNVLDGREQISLMDIDPKLSRPLLRVATITRVLTLPGLVPAEGLKTEMRG